MYLAWAQEKNRVSTNGIGGKIDFVNTTPLFYCQNKIEIMPVKRLAHILATDYILDAANLEFLYGLFFSCRPDS